MLVISRYLGMFSLDFMEAINCPGQVYVISRYLGMFSLDTIGEVFIGAVVTLFPVILGCSH